MIGSHLHRPSISWLICRKGTKPESRFLKVATEADSKALAGHHCPTLLAKRIHRYIRKYMPSWKGPNPEMLKLFPLCRIHLHLGLLGLRLSKSCRISVISVCYTFNKWRPRSLTTSKTRVSEASWCFLKLHVVPHPSQNCPMKSFPRWSSGPSSRWSIAASSRRSGLPEQLCWFALDVQAFPHLRMKSASSLPKENEGTLVHALGPTPQAL